MQNILIEETILDQQIRLLIDRKKTAREIRQKLKQKLFSEEMIEQKLCEYHEDLLDWQAHEPFFQKKICVLLEKKKSSTRIAQELTAKFPHFKEKIQELLEKNEEKDFENLETLFRQFCQKHPHETVKDQQKIQKKLLARGFSYREIRMLTW